MSVDDKRRRRFEEIDRLDSDMRALVNEEGWTIVDNFMRCGVTKASRIRHLIALIRDGTAPYGNPTFNSGVFQTVRGQKVKRED
jgi:hypothetical protein